MRAIVVIEQMASGFPVHATTALLRVDQSIPMASGAPLIEVSREDNGLCPIIGYTIDQNDSGAKIVSFWVKTDAGYTRTQYHVEAEQRYLGIVNTWGVNVTPVTTQPAGWTDASYASKTIGSLKVTGQAGTGPRMVQAGADGTQSASIPVPSAFAQTLLDDADAATARATIGVEAATTKWRDSGRDGSTFSGGGNSFLSE